MRFDHLYGGFRLGLDSLSVKQTLILQPIGLADTTCSMAYRHISLTLDLVFCGLSPDCKILYQ